MEETIIAITEMAIAYAFTMDDEVYERLKDEWWNDCKTTGWEY